MRRIDPRGDISAGEYFRMRDAPLPVGYGDESVSGQAQSGTGQPSGRANTGCGDDRIGRNRRSIVQQQAFGRSGRVAEEFDDLMFP